MDGLNETTDVLKRPASGQGLPSSNGCPAPRHLPWIALKQVPGIGNILYRRLIDRFKTPEMVFNAPSSELASVDGVTPAIIESITRTTNYNSAKPLLQSIVTAGTSLACLNDPWYPVMLRTIPDPPPLLSFYGSLDNTSPCIAIVGSRKATSYGSSVARSLGRDLAMAGFQVVSGMALGIDTAAHQGCLKAGGRTVAVLGSGLARIYPRQNRHLAETIASSGAVISEFFPEAEPEAYHFPIRNRVIAGMSMGTIVVEAAARSGSLITARLAAEFGREVFAVPGSIASSQSRGTHGLLRQGAALVTSVADVIEELGHFVHPEPAAGPRGQEDPPEATSGLTNNSGMAILEILEPYPVHIDRIVELTGLETGAVLASLLDLELKGMIRQLPGMLFIAKEENL